MPSQMFSRILNRCFHRVRQYRLLQTFNYASPIDFTRLTGILFFGKSLNVRTPGSLRWRSPWSFGEGGDRSDKVSKTKCGADSMDELERQALNPVAAKMFLAALPERIQLALLAYAKEAEYPLELVIEMAIASFLDGESLTFEDCQPEFE